MLTRVLRTPEEERLSSGAPKEEFGRMIFEKNPPATGGPFKRSVNAVGSFSWRWGVAPDVCRPAYVRESFGQRLYTG